MHGIAIYHRPFSHVVNMLLGISPRLSSPPSSPSSPLRNYQPELSPTQQRVLDRIRSTMLVILHLHTPTPRCQINYSSTLLLTREIPPSPRMRAMPWRRSYSLLSITLSPTPGIPAKCFPSLHPRRLSSTPLHSFLFFFSKKTSLPLPLYSIPAHSLSPPSLSPSLSLSPPSFPPSLCQSPPSLSLSLFQPPSSILQEGKK